MELIPAIDLLDGRVVRLFQGDFERVTIYSDDPIAVARRWVAEGATRLHLVDLDGARTGRPAQARLVARIIASVAVPCQVGGGMRTPDAVTRTLEAGADRVVLGTALLGDLDAARALFAEFGPERLVAALDVRDGVAVGSGWGAEAPGLDVGIAVARLDEVGIRWAAVTAIARDGILAGPDFDLLDRVRDLGPSLRVIASAGISTAGQVRRLARHGMAGAILGRALYEGALTLAEALAALHDAAAPGPVGPTDDRPPG